jgi:hypothetical protein
MREIFIPTGRKETSGAEREKTKKRRKDMIIAQI